MNAPSGQSPLLSIIVVAHRSRDEIGPCLASLPREIAGKAVEVIVVDNSPGDGTEAIVRRDFPWVRYVAPGENLGFGRANNLGYWESSGHFLLFLNPDTVSNAAALEHCWRRLQTEPGIGLISPQLVQADGTMDLACRRSIPTLWDGFCRASGLAAAFPRVRVFAGYNLTHLPAGGTYDVGAINGAFMMTRREVLERVATADFVAEPRGGTASRSANPSEREAAPPREIACPFDELRAPSLSRGGQAPPSLPGPAHVFDEAFFMYGDDLDLCIRVARAGYRIVYDGRVRIIHLKGVSVAKDCERMARAIFDANRDVFLKHFNPRGSALVRWKYELAFGAWKALAQLGARIARHRHVKPI